jgi:predicted porin
MKMNKTLLAILAMSSVAGVAQAQVNLINSDQSELSLYGILDAGMVQMTGAGNISPNFVTGAVPTGSAGTRVGTVRGMMNGGESQSRWGIKGSEDLGDGNKAFFQLESAIDLGSGQLGTSGLSGSNGIAGAASTPTRNMIADTSLNGQLFNRNAFIGLSNTDLGAVSFGRQNSVQLDVITATGGGYDPVNAQMFSPINFSGVYGGGGTTDNARVDNAIKYANKFGNFNVNVLYAFGGIAGSSTARSNAELNAGYEADTFGVQAAMQQANDTTVISPGTTGAAPNLIAAGPYTVNAQFVKLTSYMLTGRYKVTEPLMLKAGFERMEYNAPSNFAADQGMNTIYSYTIATATAFSGPQRNLNVYWLGGNYDVSSKTKVSVGYYDVEQPAYGAGTGTTASGSDKYFSAMVEYNLSKKTNVYAAFMQDKKSGALSATANNGLTYIPNTFNTYGAGLRVKF